MSQHVLFACTVRTTLLGSGVCVLSRFVITVALCNEIAVALCNKRLPNFVIKIAVALCNKEGYLQMPKVGGSPYDVTSIE